MAYDTDTSASCEGKQSRCDRRCNYQWQDDVPAAIDWTWHIALLCQLRVCGVHVLDGSETHEDMFEENAQTEARGARCLHASELKQWSKRPGSQSVTKKNLSLDGLRRSCYFGLSVSRRLEERRHQTIQKKKHHTALPWGRGHVHRCCCLCFDKQATAPSHPSLRPVLSPARSKITKFARGTA